MKKKSIFILVLSIILLCITGTICVFANPEYLPQSGIVSLSVEEINSDPGFSWLLNSWKTSDRESLLREFVDTITFDTMGVSILPSGPSGKRELILVLNVGGGNAYDFNKLKAVIKETPETPVSQKTYQSQMIYYADNELNDYNAFTVSGGSILIGTSTMAIEEALGRKSFTDVPQYKDASVHLSEQGDAILFASNRDLQFAEFLDPLQQKWKLTLLLSSDSLEWIASSFDVIDSDKLSGEIIFKGDSTDSIDDVADDASFIGEAFKRKFMAENIQYSSDVTVDRTYVTLSFDCSGLQPLWLRLFEQGALSVISPE